MQKQFTVYNDPGHGWLVVKVADLFDAGVQHSISRYSYIRGLSAYLEEDCDAGKFLENFRNKYGKDSVVLKHKYTDDNSPIRSYDRYSVFAAEQVYKRIMGW